MINVTCGDILRADAEALVNTVNCVGVMGRGIALQFKKAYPDNFKFYKKICDNKKLAPGKVLVYDLENFVNPRYIINFPTKRHWRGKSRIEYIDTGLEALVAQVKKLGIQSIALPPLGCGLGGLNWGEVRSRIEQAFSELPEVNVILYEPSGSPDAKKMVKEHRIPKLTPGRAALLELMARYLVGLMDPIVSLLEIHKLMYFLQEAGEALNLAYNKSYYGPYAENLRYLLSHIEGHFIYGYGDAEDNPRKEIELNHEILPSAKKFLADHRDTETRLEKVTKLIEGFETPFGMELLSTVHWVVVHENAQGIEEVINRIYAWGERKKMFKQEQIELAWNVFNDQGWFHITTGEK